MLSKSVYSFLRRMCGVRVRVEMSSGRTRGRGDGGGRGGGPMRGGRRFDRR